MSVGTVVGGEVNRAAHDRAERASWERRVALPDVGHLPRVSVRQVIQFAARVAVVSVEVQRMTDLDGEVLTRATSLAPMEAG